MNAEAMRRFKAGKLRFFFFFTGKGGTGLNLQNLSHHNVYYSDNDSYIARSQSEDRTHRNGTIGVVEYTNLIARQGADKAIQRRHEAKSSFSEMRFDLREIFEG